MSVQQPNISQRIFKLIQVFGLQHYLDKRQCVTPSSAMWRRIIMLVYKTGQVSVGLL